MKSCVLAAIRDSITLSILVRARVLEVAIGSMPLN
jgi:hypothetical protein